MTKNSLTGIILAGGQSSRFKSPKYLAEISGKSLLDLSISKLQPLCQEIIVVSKEPIERREARGERRENRGQSPLERKGDSPQKQSVSDVALYDRGHPFEKGVSPRSVIEKDKHYHPLVGIKEGLKASNNDANVVLACDTPFVSLKMILGLINSKAEVCLYRYKGRVEPLLGFYRKSCSGKIAGHLIYQPRTTNHKPRKNSRLIDAIAKCNIDYIEVTKDCLDFFNINTKEDLVEAQKIAQRNPQLLGN